MSVEHDFQSFFLEDDVDCRNTNFNEDKIMILSQDKMSSTNWPAPNVWVFISQRVKHCSMNAEVMGSNPVEVSKLFAIS